MQEDEALKIYQVRFRELIAEPHTDFFWTSDYENFKDILSEEDFKKALRLKKRKRDRRRRCFKKLETILGMYEESFCNNGEYCVLVFGTCTFNDKELELKEETRTKKINKWLREHFDIALVNIDYGKKKEREHHHFVGITRELLQDTGKRSKSGYPLYELRHKTYKLGFEPDLEIIDDLSNERKLSNYLVKLNFHSNKKSTKNRRIRLIKK